MSTVVFRDGVLAADTLMVQGSVKCPEGMNKMTMGTTHPVIYAMAGRTAALAAAVRIIEAMPIPPWDGGEYPTKLPLDHQSELAVFHRDGRIFSVETDGWWFEPAKVPFMALGSGAKAALGALHMGADAVHAVEIASLVDAFTGGSISIMRVADIWRDRASKDVKAGDRKSPTPVSPRAWVPPERTARAPSEPARLPEHPPLDSPAAATARRPALVLNRFRHEPRAAASRVQAETQMRDMRQTI